MNDKICVGIIYPADPMGTIPGGIDTFIRGILRWVPDDIEMHLVGVSTDAYQRPVGKWTQCDLGRSKFWFYPVLTLGEPGKRSNIPLSLRFTAALMVKKIGCSFDVIEFHRIEPSLLYWFDMTPKTAVIHTNMEALYNKNADIRWKAAPWLFFKLEDWLLQRMSSVFVVREDAVRVYRTRYSALADRFNFTPTWMDPDLFYPISKVTQGKLKAELAEKYGFLTDEFLLISVGRLDQSKDPLLLLSAFAAVSERISDVRLLFVGDGVLREQIAQRIAELRMEGKVIIAGLRSAKEVADLLRVSGIFILSSAYEGMPMCVLEALGTGVPVVTTDVGEVRRVVKPRENGEIARDRSVEALADAIISCHKNYRKYAGQACTDAASDYVPAKVLAPMYENYRRLAAMKRAEL
ncbi:MAG: glycosyltransferase family 4 protein [Pseudomonadota bacterium]